MFPNNILLSIKEKDSSIKSIIITYIMFTFSLNSNVFLNPYVATNNYLSIKKTKKRLKIK